jgi:hypothetical protein
MIFCLGLVSGPLSARFLAVASQLFKVPGAPFPLSPSPAGLWQVDEAAGTVMVAAQAHSDIFIDPGDGFANGSSGGDAGISLNAESMLNAATLLGVPPHGDFQFSARVTVGFASTFLSPEDGSGRAEREAPSAGGVAVGLGDVAGASVGVDHVPVWGGAAFARLRRRRPGPRRRRP